MHAYQLFGVGEEFVLRVKRYGVDPANKYSKFFASCGSNVYQSGIIVCELRSDILIHTNKQRQINWPDLFILS